MTAKAAIQYHPDGFRPGPLGIMGRQSAGAGFLDGFVRHSGLDDFTAAVTSEAHGDEFRQIVAAIRPEARSSWLSPPQYGAEGSMSLLMLAGPDLGQAAWTRRAAPAGYSLCGLTHTTASHRVMDCLADMLTAPVQPWDALICTSAAVKGMVQGVMDGHADYLRDRLGAQSIPRPQLPVIPLGVDVDRFARSGADRAAARAWLGAGPSERVVLSVGRLSFHAKAHPLPLYMALEQAARTAKIPVRLVLAGWFANEGQRQVFEAGAAALAPSVTLQWVDGRIPADLKRAWAAADIFTLLSDNIQETFGLAPIEAMAAGLPVVISDWDGFRDTVEHGLQGMRIPTVQPPPGSGSALALRYDLGIDDYDAYVGAASQSVSVDVGRAAEAFAALLQDEGLCARMGQSGLARARAVYDWSVIVRRYQDLWADLDAIRAKAGTVAPVVRAARPDPFAAFSGYPSRRLEGSTRLQAYGDLHALAAILGRRGAVTRPQLLLPETQLQEVLQSLILGQRTVDDLLASLPRADHGRLMRSLVWLMKFDLVRAG